MGNYCGCLKEQISQNSELNSNLEFKKNKSLLSELERNTEQIIKIQGLIRGFLTRKKVASLMNEHYKNKVNEQLSAFSSSILNFNTRVGSSFYYGHDDEEEPYSHLKEFRGTVNLESGAKYFGEWFFIQNL